jgi:hypothetical protein
MEFAIRDVIDVDCECGHAVPIKLNDSYPLAQCQNCKEFVKVRVPLTDPDAVELLECFGITVTVDYDGQLILHSDEIPDVVGQFVFRNQVAIKKRFERIRARSQQMFVGGSLAGKGHQYGRICEGHAVNERICKGHWETYESRDYSDPRLYFVGRSTSEKNAKARKFVK